MGSWATDHNEHEMNESCHKTLKHRQVKHFGYEFCFHNNNVDRNKPLLNQKIPNECDRLWPRISEQILIEKRPDQLTVNKYEPGQGRL